MKKATFFFLVIATLTTTFYSCKTNTDDLWDSIHQLDGRVTSLEELCKQMNGNISSLQKLVQALQDNNSITMVTPVKQGDKTIGYTISFTKGEPITIYHGEKGDKGEQGDKGETGDKGDTGDNGKDGTTPIIGVKQHADGIYYWTLNGDWLRDNSGNMIKAEGKDGTNGNDGTNGEDGKDGEDGLNGKDGITPLLEIRNGRWYLSSDDGQTWTDIGQATGESGKDGVNGTDGKNGDSLFQEIDYTSDLNFVIFTLADGTILKLPTWYAFGNLQQLCEQINSNISSMQLIIEALQQKDAITNVEVISENGYEIGYKLYFEKHTPITIYHGKNGQDGTNGSDGEDGDDGANGKDGTTPNIGVKQDTDGIYYWTLNNDWLKDENGHKIKAQGTDGNNGNDGNNGADGTDGKDGITPQLKIEEDYWYISYDNGSNWTKLGKATGADGTSGDAFFKNVTEDDDYVYLEMQAGNIISVPKHKKLSITFNETEDIRVLANQTYPIQYTITGATDKTVVKALAQDGFRAVVKSTDSASGVIEVTTPTNIVSSEILIFISDGEERTIMRSINFVEGVINITDRSYTVPYTGGTVSVQLSTNIDYTIEIPEADKTWISIAPTSRAIMRDETITFNVQQNNNTQLRYSIIKLVDKLGVTSETIQITQRGGSSQDIHVTTAGTLEQQIDSEDAQIIEELKITGHLNTFDYEFLKTMPNLKTVDLSELDDTIIPASAFSGSKVSAVLLPLRLRVISNRAFYQSGITSLYIPETVESIGEYAYAETANLVGNVSIPKNTAIIGDCAFLKSAFDGTLIMEEGIRSIGNNAFEYCEKVQGDLVIPNSVTTLGTYAFAHSTFTGSLSIGNGVTDIPNYAFQGCNSFKGKITIGENVESIGSHAFAGCRGFTGNLIIPDNVESIGEDAFYNCTGFTGYLSLGSSVTKIGNYAFSSSTRTLKATDESNNKAYTYTCEGLFNTVYCKANVPPTLDHFSLKHKRGNAEVYSEFGWNYGYQLEVYVGAGLLYHTYTGTRPKHLLVPMNCYSTYKNTIGWDDFDLIEEVEF